MSYVVGHYVPDDGKPSQNEIIVTRKAQAMSAEQELRGDMLEEFRALLIAGGSDDELCACGCQDIDDKGRTPSKYQSAILHTFRMDKANMLIQAVAGSGKTSTLEMLARMMDGDAIYLAFNKTIAEEVKTKLPSHVQVSTFHALGWNAVRPALQSKLGGRVPGPMNKWITSNKCRDIFRAEYGETDLRSAESGVCKLVSLMKAHLMLPSASDSDIIRLIDRFDVECDDDNIDDDALVSCARRVLEVSNETFYPIDFDDQLYLPFVLNVRIRSVANVMVDECQDTNAARRWILAQLVKRGGRLIAVGDVFQAIYGFTGADSDSMARIGREFQCKEMPLSISYRCSGAVVREAQKYVTGIEARDGAPLGDVRGVSDWPLEKFVADDLIVCRNTAPLVKVAYAMIARRLPCKILGRDIASGLITLCEKVGGRNCRTLEELKVKLTAYVEREVSKARDAGQDGRAQSVTDKVETVLTLIDGLTDDDYRKGVTGLIAREQYGKPGSGGIIARMFTDNGGRVTTFSTIHKAKGLEANRVFLLDAHLMPSKYARQAWQQEQERNLRYVAITRAMTELVYVDSDSLVDQG